MAPRKIAVLSLWLLTASVSSATAGGFQQQGSRETPSKEAHRGNHDRTAMYLWRETYDAPNRRLVSGERPQNGIRSTYPWRITYTAPNRRFIYRVGDRGKIPTCYSEALIEFAWYIVDNTGCR